MIIHVKDNNGAIFNFFKNEYNVEFPTISSLTTPTLYLSIKISHPNLKSINHLTKGFEWYGRDEFMEKVLSIWFDKWLESHIISKGLQK